MASAALAIHFQNTFGASASAVRIVYLFADRPSAEVVFEQLKTATAAYHARANDRERIVSFEYLSGCAAVDVSTIAAFGVDDPFGEQAAAVEEWNTNVGALTGKHDGAKENAKIALAPAQTTAA